MVQELPPGLAKKRSGDSRPEAVSACAEVRCYRAAYGIVSEIMITSQSRPPNFQKAAIEQYLCTGEHDALFRAWAGETFTARARQGDLALRAALIALVKSRTGRALVPQELADLDVVSFTRTKVGPMVRGFFPKAEQQPVLDVLARSVVFLTPATIEPVLNRSRFLMTAWNLSNLYLASCGSKLLSDDAPTLVGLSEETTCYVSMAYFKLSGGFSSYTKRRTSFIIAKGKRSVYRRPDAASGCSTSTLANVRHLPTRARFTAASLSSVAALRPGGSYYRLPRRTSRCRMIGSLRASTSTPSAPQLAPEMDGRKFCRIANFLSGDGPLRRTGRHDVKRCPSNAGCNSRNIS
jgi:hypothetical protein